MPAYVPPALRKKLEVEGQVSPQHRAEALPSKSSPRHQPRKELYSITDVRHHFWPSSSEEIPPLSSLNSSAKHPFELTWVLLHRDQNPRWKTDNIVFAKTSLNLLPDYFAKKGQAIQEWEMHNLRTPNEEQLSLLEHSSLNVPSRPDSDQDNHHKFVNPEISSPEARKDAEGVDAPCDAETVAYYPRRRQMQIKSAPAIDWEPSAHPSPPPIAVFEEVRYKEFRFLGWYAITRVSILAPFSQELVRMLEQKWTLLDRFGKPKKGTDRDRSSWQKSLSCEWAVVKFEKMEGEDSPAPPSIEHAISPEPEPPRKSVNEQLAEMRLADKENREVGQEFDDKRSAPSNSLQSECHGKEDSG